MQNYVEQACEEIRAKVGKEKVILGLSGGVDSSVAAALIHKAIGDQLTCVFVDNGLLRLHRDSSVRRGYRDWAARRLLGPNRADRFGRGRQAKHFADVFFILDARGNCPSAGCYAVSVGGGLALFDIGESIGCARVGVRVCRSTCGCIPWP
jgi:hypothetical protein